MVRDSRVAHLTGTNQHLTHSHKPAEFHETEIRLPKEQIVLARFALEATRARHWVVGFVWVLISALLSSSAGAQDNTETPARSVTSKAPPTTYTAHLPVAAENAATLTPMCQGVADEAPCWRAIANQPGCFLWDAHPAARESANFHGTSTCADGRLNGSGKTIWNWYDEDSGWRSSSGDGAFLDGKANGSWVIEWTDGGVVRGPYIEGQRHGQWVIEDADGDVGRGRYVNGEEQGTWVYELASGGVLRGSYVNGKEHGTWELERVDGKVVDRFRYSHGERTEETRSTQLK